MISRKGFVQFIPMIFGVGGSVIGGLIGGGAIGGIGLAPMFGMTGTQLGATLGFMMSSMVGSALFPSETDIEDPVFGDMETTVSMKSGPIPAVLGTDTVNGNVVWASETTFYQQKHRVGSTNNFGFVKVHYEYSNESKRSFLLGVVNGPASILRVWEGKELLDIYNNPDIYVFDGQDNEGIKDFTGEDYGEWPYTCFIGFKDWELHGSSVIPNFRIEVSSAFGFPFFAGSYSEYTTHELLWKVKADGTLDAEWGDNGMYKHEDPEGGTTNTAFLIHHMSDGRLLVFHNSYWIEGTGVSDPDASQVIGTMLTKDGQRDTSWGYNGFYRDRSNPESWNYATSGSSKFLYEDPWGYFHLFSQWGYYHKFDSNGNMVMVKQQYDATLKQLVQTHSGCSMGWVDREGENGIRLILVGVAGNIPSASYISNMMAVLITKDDTVLDEEWGGGAVDRTPETPSAPGYALVGPVGNYWGDAHEVIKAYDGGIYVLHDYGSQPGELHTHHTLSKLNADGKAYDQGFGIINFDGGKFYDEEEGIYRRVRYGRAAAGWPFYHGYKRSMKLDGENVVVLASYYAIAVSGTYLTTFNKYGSVIQRSEDLVNAMHHMTIVSGQIVCIKYGTGDNIWVYNRYSHNLMRTYDPTGLDITRYCNVFDPIVGEGSDYDINPITAIKEIVTNTKWGARKTAIVNEETFGIEEAYCASQNMGISLVMNKQKPWQDYVDYILSHIGGFRYQSGGELCVGMFKNESSIIDITKENLVRIDPEDSGPLIDVVERSRSGSYNRIIVTYKDRSKDYATGVVVANDRVDQKNSGIRWKVFKLDAFKNIEAAKKAATRLLIESMYRMHSYKFTLGYEMMLLQVGSIVTISDGEKISNKKVRMLPISEDINGRGLSVEAVDEISEFYPELVYTSQESERDPDSQVDLVSSPINFMEDTLENKIYICIVPDSIRVSSWGIYVSSNGTDYEFLGTTGIEGVTDGGANCEGTITGFMPAHNTPGYYKDETITVDVGEVVDFKGTINNDDFFNNKYLARIDDEIIGYGSAVETSVTGVWELTGLLRGLFETEAVAHYTGEDFATLKPNVEYEFSNNDVGKTLYFKAAAIYGPYSQDLADVTAYSVTIQGYAKRPAAASLLRLDSDEFDGAEQGGSYSGATFTLHWNLGAKDSGAGVGGYGVGTVNHYVQDPELQAIVLRFEEENGTLISERETTIKNSETITKATDLNGINPAIVKVIPRRNLRSRLENYLKVDDRS
jgi:hypothetical protein